MTKPKPPAPPSADETPLSPADARFGEAVTALLTEKTIKAAASKVGVHERTLRRWLEREDFAAAIRAARRQQIAQAATGLAASAPTFIATLTSIAEDGKAPHASRVAAARAGLELARGFIETDDLADRIAQLEAAAEQTRERGA